MSKLYTEEQVKDMLELTNLNVQFHIDTMIPIELPSDEEIEEEEAEKRFPYEKHMGDTWGNGLHEGFFIGAEWMKEQILN